MSDLKNIKNTNLPPEIADIKGSTSGVKFNVAIAQKYGLEGKKITDLAFLIADLYYKEAVVTDLVGKIRSIFNFDDAKAKKMALDIAGMRLLVVNDWLGGKIGDYIISLGGNPNDYKSMSEEQVASAKKEREDFEKELMKEKELEGEIEKKLVSQAAVPGGHFSPPAIDYKKEKEDNVKVFNSDLADLLYFLNNDYANFYNLSLLDVLSSEDGQKFKDDLVRALSANQEKLTSAPFMLDGKVFLGTIDSWLKYFIKEKGSAMFDNIILTNFLTDSQNCKVLSEEEKKAVKKLLLLYRNLKFFPDSMPNQTGEGWEIIPSEGEVSDSDKARTVSTPQTDDFSAKAKEVAAVGVISEDNKKKTEELKLMLANYPSGSLERKAIEEEIRKLEVRI